MRENSTKFIWLLALYFLLSLAVRVALSGGLELDESEQLLLTQVPRLGYGPQPPLYMWLQYLVFVLFGTSIFSLSILKNTLLFVFFTNMYFISRKILGDDRGAKIAVLSLFLSPQFGWEFHRTLTNTVLATAMATIFVIIVLRIRKKPTALLYILLGCVAGLGILGKYNFALLLAAMLVSGLTLAEWRPFVLNWRILLSAVFGTLVSIPHFLWVLGHVEQAAAFSTKLEISDGPVLLIYGQGVMKLLMASVGLFWPFLFVYFFLFLTTRRTGSSTAGADAGIVALLGRTILITLLLCLAIVFATHLTRFNDRWLAPLLFFVPIYLVYLLKSRITPGRYLTFVTLSAAGMVLILVISPGRVLLASKTGKALRNNYPYAALAGSLREAGFDGGNIIAQNHRVGGNLRLYFQGSSVNVPGRPAVPLLDSRPFLVVWDATDDESIPGNLLEYGVNLTGQQMESLEPSRVEAPMLYFKEKAMRLGYYIIAR